MFRNIRWAIVGTVLILPVIAGIVGVKILQFKTMGEAFAQMVMPPESVNAIEVREESYQPRIATVGSVEAVQGTVVSTETAGIVRAVSFEAGAMVEAGEELVRLDTEVEQAQLRSAEAAAELASLSYKRATDLIEKRGVSQAELDSAHARLKEAEAQVDYYRALIERKTVRAPFTGKLGIHRISIGQYLNQGSPVVSLQSLDPVYVEFSLPQQRLGDVSEGLDVAVSSDSYPGEVFRGRITAVNPDVDPETRNVRIQATLANPGNRLRPGMFVTIELIEAEAVSQLFIPATAVMHSPFGDSVFVIEEGEAAPDGTRQLVIRQKVISLGTRRGDFVAVTDGVEAGMRIVSTGVFKLQPGMAVVIDNALAPAFSFTPSPGNT